MSDNISDGIISFKSDNSVFVKYLNSLIACTHSGISSAKNKKDQGSSDQMIMSQNMICKKLSQNALLLSFGHFCFLFLLHKLLLLLGFLSTLGLLLGF